MPVINPSRFRKIWIRSSAQEPPAIFDAAWYLEMYPDIVGTDPLAHFNSIGWAEGRKPHPLFDTDWYLQQNPDVELSGMNPLLHYMSTGWREGRFPNPLFHTQWYLHCNPDVREADIDPLTHYILAGAEEGRRPNPLFDPVHYASVWGSDQAGHGYAFAHYLTVGWLQGLSPHALFDPDWYRERAGIPKNIEPVSHFLFAQNPQSPHPLFDAQWYLDQYSDVKISGQNPLIHYIEAGWREFRSPSPYFDAAGYIKKNLQTEGGSCEPLQHYLRSGWRLGLSPGERFNTAHYLGSYEDVRKAEVNPLIHYIKVGAAEGRRPLPEPRKIIPGPDLSALRPNSSDEEVRASIVRVYDEWPEGLEKQFIEGMKAEVGGSKVDALQKASIVLPTYNRAATLAAAINSVVAQTYRCWELLIVDDGSTDETIEIVQEFLSDDRIHYFRQPNLGVASARNKALSLATGDVVFYIDSDNIWRPEHIDNMLKFMGSGHLDAAYCGLRGHGDLGETLFYRGAPFSWRECRSRNYIDMNTFAHTRRSAEQAGIRFDIGLRRLVDWDFILRVTRQARVSFAPYLGVDYYHGSAGDRITFTEYVDGQLATIESTIRNKHAAIGSDYENADVLAFSAFMRSGHVPSASDLKLNVRFFPDYRINNSYQSHLYSEFVAADVKPASMAECLKELIEVGGDERFVFHLHWTNPIFAPGRDDAEADKLVDKFISDARMFLSLGGKIYWTIHNVLSHEPKYRSQEIRLAKKLCELAEFVHVHDARTAELASEFYAIPQEKVLVAAHGSYVGALPSEMSRSQARKILNIPENATVYALFGQLRAYKGLDELIEAYRRILVDQPNAWLLIAGKPLGIDVRELQERLSCFQNIVFRPEFIPDDEVQIYMRSSDVAVLPYRQVLTSGSALLALSFSLPVIAPDKGLLNGVLNSGTDGYLFGTREIPDLEAAMALFGGLSAEKQKLMSEAAFHTAASFKWSDTSRKLHRFMSGERLGERRTKHVAGHLRTFFIRNEHRLCENNKCCAIVLHYSNIEDTIRCVDSCLMQTGGPSILIVSNSEKIEDALSLADKYPNLTIIQTEDNIGYASGNNIGLWYAEHVGYEFFWIINPDIVVPRGYYQEILSLAEAHPQYNLFGSAITYGADESRVWYAGGSIDYDNGGFSFHQHMGEPLANLPREPFETDYITGANIFGRVSVINKIGFIPEEYFLYFEETDWFARAAREGERGLINPACHVAHWKRSEVGGLPTRAYCYYFVRNALIFGEKYAPGASEARQKRVNEFIEAWMAKIENRAPDRKREFEILFQKAIADGKSGVTGRVAI
nr:glycosyltransferase [uncultured Hyphomonas sp.]